ncbi:TonB-dependent receptor plug domain-containing protein [Erythrobacter sp.]|jgi:vitamin B12 transporter|uniref:TonB-dependent receptor plug domain-containing protein n=1 Tax=Erythrobacter sp. TaxID=1042 RepID=UPI002EBFDC36|nr:TonB-dependent receptor [Erythrobacter sp.]
MKYHATCGVLAAFVLCAPQGLLAQGLPEPAQDADIVDRQGGEAASDEAIVVTANRTARSLSQVGSSVAVIAEEEIVNRQPSDVLDILRTVPGVTINRSGGIGAAAGVSIRGAQSDQSVVLVDGIKINDPASPGGGFDFGPLLAGNIARIEVVRGAQSVLYGSQAIGGVVNLITREPTRDVAIFASAQYGGRDTAELVGNISGRAGPIAASLGATFLTTDGISAFSAARGGTERDGFESVGVNGKVDVRFAEGLALDLRGFYADSELEIDGFAPPTFAFGDTEELSERRDFVGYAGLNAALFDNRFHNRLAFAYTDIDRRNLDLSGDDPFESFAAQGENRRFEYQGIVDLQPAQIVMGAEREESEFATASFGASSPPAETAIDSLYAQVNVTPIEPLSLSGGVRYDDHEIFGSQTSFSASGALALGGGDTVLRASFGEGFKAPSLFQLLSDFGNSALQPETSQSFDAGVSHAMLDGAIVAGLTWFTRDATNEIVFVGCFENPLAACNDPDNPRPFGTYDNIARSKADGWELTLDLAPLPGMDVALGYAIIDAENAVTGERLPRRPDATFSLVADYRLASGLALGASVLMVGESFDDAANQLRLDGYTLVDLRASYALSDGLELFGRVENITDEKYETAFRFGQPGRAVFGGVRYRM